jgi:peptide/nickel transport system substrate-binding protein
MSASVRHQNAVTRRDFLSLTGLAFTVPLLVACSQGPSASPGASSSQGTGGVITYTPSVEPDTLDPADALAQVPEQVFLNVFDRLIHLAPDMTVKRGLATDWSPSPDGITWTFTLRSGAQFHDGSPVDADAVKFTFDRLLDSNKPLRRRGAYAPFIKGLRAADPTARDASGKHRQPEGRSTIRS